MSSIKEMIARREELTKQRKILDEEIVSLWNSMRFSLLEELIEAGLFNSKWIVIENIGAFSTLPMELYLDTTDRRMYDKCSAIIEKYESLKNCSIELPVGGATLLAHCGYGRNISINFPRNGKPQELIKHYNLDVDYSYYDDQIESLIKKRKEVSG